MSYSDGGALTLSSPTHRHHIDVTHVARKLRHSLSRSPSKFRLITKSPSPSPQSPLSPSPPKRHLDLPSSTNTPCTAPNTPSPLVPFPPSAKLALRSASRSKATTPRSASRTRTSPKSPMKRALSQTSDAGNSLPSSSQGSAEGQENIRSTTPATRKSFERISKMTDSPGPVNYALSRLNGGLGCDGASDTPMSSSISSPLKRSDTLMNLDQASLGSPVAKRRSLHGSGSFGADFNVFEHGPQSFDIHDDSTNEYELSTASITADNPLSFTSMPRRSSSLRKSTLQQRHDEKTSWGRRRAAAQALLAQQQANAGHQPEVSTPNQTKNRPRLSLDQFVAPLPRDSPFNTQGSLPNPSAHLMQFPPHAPHPLSRTMTTSSSSGSITDESPTHVPVNFGEKPKLKMDFSKSLPLGVFRPFTGFDSMEDDTYATPQNNFRTVKPHAAAFGSTGLISKMNKNPEEPRLMRGKAVPDTPCKKQSNMFNTYPSDMPSSAIAKARHLRHSFGNPSTPFNPHGNTPASNALGQGSGVFGGGFSGRGMIRRGSFLSIDGDEFGGSPDGKGDSQSSGEADFPPTPTKSIFAPPHVTGSPSNHRSFQLSGSGIGLGLRSSTKGHQRKSSKLNPFTSPTAPEVEDSDGSLNHGDDSPSIGHAGRIRKKSADGWAFMNRASSECTIDKRSSPSLLPRSSTTFQIFHPTPNYGFAKTSRVAPASPLDRTDMFDRFPQTPRDSIMPPDPSGLSISVHREPTASQSMPPPQPATPTTGRDFFSVGADRRLSTTPINSHQAPDVDESLKSRFDKIELVGTGVFSQVYKVSKVVPRAPQLMFAKASSRSVSPASTLEQVFAVKKSTKPYIGFKDRTRRLQEVRILKALGKSDHVVEFFDSWELNNHLYIQTEYCEEGSLDVFLAQAGKKGRLDDFRIWKIALELGKGLKHIHDSGFIHLDLKPANILVTFEGVLKIADFGLACSWPAPPGHEGEGDREYIGPEILRGDYDKPADIFSFGIIMVEIACNVALPGNGESWTKLRSGDVSDAPSLTWSNDSLPARDATGMVIDEDCDSAMDTTFAGDESFDVAFGGSPTLSTRRKNALGSAKSLSHDAGNLFGTLRRGELHKAPVWMKDQMNEFSLDNLAISMINPTPELRPTIDQVLSAGGLRWVEPRRRAGATVFEGDYGPADEILADDAEMMDV